METLIEEHNVNPGLRILQKELAKSITQLVHGEENYNAAVEASSILFKKGDAAIEALKGLSSTLFMEIFDGVPQKQIPKSDLAGKVSIIDLMVGVEDLIANQYILLQRGKKNYFVLKIS